MILIRQGTINDLDNIVELSAQLFEKHYKIDPEYFEPESDYTAKMRIWAEQQTTSANLFLSVAFDDQNKKICGFISGFIKYLFPWYKIKSVGHISFLAVYPEFQNMGIGKQLESSARQWFIERNIKYIEVYTNEKNTEGVAAWMAYGYTPFNKFLQKKITS